MRTAAALAIAVAVAVFLAPLGALASPARAGSRVDERRPARPDGLVEIDNSAGLVKVLGWDRAEVAVTGTLGPGAEGLDFRSQGHRTRIGVETSGNPQRVRSDLEIRVPEGSRVEVESLDAPIDVSGVKGSVKAQNVNAGITVTGSAGEVEAETVNGGVSVTGPATRVRAESVNGAVEVRGSSGVVEAATVNGRLVVAGGKFERGQLETVNGSIRFEGLLSPRATLDVETVGGSVELVLPADLAADFSVYTYNGEVDNQFGATSLRKGREEGQKELSFSIGSGGAKVTIHTLNGNVTLRKR